METQSLGQIVNRSRVSESSLLLFKIMPKNCCAVPVSHLKFLTLLQKFDVNSALNSTCLLAPATDSSELF